MRLGLETTVNTVSDARRYGVRAPAGSADHPAQSHRECGAVASFRATAGRTLSRSLLSVLHRGPSWQLEKLSMRRWADVLETGSRTAGQSWAERSPVCVAASEGTAPWSRRRCAVMLRPWSTMLTLYPVGRPILSEDASATVKPHVTSHISLATSSRATPQFLFLTFAHSASWPNTFPGPSRAHRQTTTILEEEQLRSS